MNIVKNISNRIEPNYSTWQTIELSYNFAKQMIDENIEGDFVECGVAAGNNLAAMCAAGRHGFGFDSFEGIPWAGENDDIQPGMDHKTNNVGLISSGISSHSFENVESDMKKWGIENYTLIKGWFQHTVPLFGQRPISVLRLDGDLYESTLIPLEYLYSMLSVGGILILDDWNLAGCRKAFDYYFDQYYSDLRNIPKAKEIYCDGNVKYFKKWA